MAAAASTAADGERRGGGPALRPRDAKRLRKLHPGLEAPPPLHGATDCAEGLTLSLTACL